MNVIGRVSSQLRQVNSRCLSALAILQNPLEISNYVIDAQNAAFNLSNQLNFTQGSATVQVLDEISNGLCGVADIAEALRNLHPDDTVRAVCQNAVLSTADSLTKLNTSKAIFASMAGSLNDPTLSSEENAVLSSLYNEQIREGARLPEGDKFRLHNLSQSIARLGFTFQSNISSSNRVVTVDKSLVTDCPVCTSYAQTDSEGNYQIPISYVTALLPHVKSPEVRKLLFMARYEEPSANEDVFSEMIQKRHELAQLQGHSSFRESQATTLMEDPKSVDEFLSDVSEVLSGPAEKELKWCQDVLGTKKVYLSDIPRVQGLVTKPSKSPRADLSQYLTIENCLTGVLRMMSEAFHVSITPSRAAPECWHRDVIKCCVARDGEPLGTFFVDLFARPHKTAQPCTFTLLSRKKLKDDSYQNPCLVVSLSIQPDANISMEDCEALWHEFGHVAHGLFSHTTLQHVSGTRSPLDFVETPSLMFESLASKTASKWAKNSFGEPAPQGLIEEFLKTRNTLKASIAVQQTIHSIFDLAVHSGPNINATMLYRQLFDEYSKIGPPPGDFKYYLSFGHLVPYAASYYCYLRCRVAASQVLSFIGNDLNRDTGPILETEFLGHGSAVDPKAILASFKSVHADPSFFFTNPYMT